MGEDAAGSPGLQWYADAWGRRSRQVAVDAAVAAWVLGWVVLGVLVHQAVSALVPPVLAVVSGAEDISGDLDRTSEGLSSLPLLGDELGAPLRGAADSMQDLAAASARTADLVGDLALLVGVLLPLGPVCLVVALWLPVRLRFARRAGAARRLLAGGADPQLFALRALATHSLPRLTAVSADPVGDWRRGDPEVTRALARLELDALGVDARGLLGREDLAPGRLSP